MSMSHRSHLTVLLIRPSKYDDDGYVIRHWRGVLPSNTLNCLHGLTDDAIRTNALGDVRLTVRALDEAVDRVEPRRLARRYLRRGGRAVVALAGVQTNQFPRAHDLAVQFKAEGFDVMVGGFHVSGAIATAAAMPPECQAMIDAGITLVLGEVEGRWVELLRDAATGTLRPLYDFLDAPPDLGAHPVPMPSPRLQRKFAVRGTGTIDMSRGCPFRCSFCTIISVQGRTMRARDPQRVLEQIRANARPSGRHRAITHYFFTDDNFSRNPIWEAIFDGLIVLRETEHVRIDFMMQVDIAAWRIPRFVEKAARAGCVQVFIGMESIREDNLQSVGKRQNRVDTYRTAIAAWHACGVVCHVGYIIGFPNDSYARVMEDVRALRDDLQVDQASFFVLTPLPGSQDHVSAVARGVPLERDYNRYDSFHVTQPHPVMSSEEWMRAFGDAWRAFYAFDQMEQALLRQNPHTYWGLFKVFLWYRVSMLEGAHPMITGFLRLKQRTARRPGLPLEGRLRFMRKRVAETLSLCRGYVRVAVEMQELWLRTRIRRHDYVHWALLRGFATRAQTPSHIKLGWSRVHTEFAAQLDALGARGRYARRRLSATMHHRLEAIREAIDDHGAYVRGADVAPLQGEMERAVPSSPGSQLVRAVVRALNPMKAPSLESRRRLTRYWTHTGMCLRRWHLWRINPARLSWNLALDVRNMLVFLAATLTERY
jgi:radical SAM superfamily enzyme YgiQ (UPF0313 family)